MNASGQAAVPAIDIKSLHAKIGELIHHRGREANATNSRGAIAALVNELGLDWGAASKLLGAITAKHRPVADIFCSDAGVQLMRIDSDITIDAVKRCLAQSIAVLPVHDSLVVPANVSWRKRVIPYAHARGTPEQGH
jgi:hypothetical protein